MEKLTMYQCETCGEKYHLQKTAEDCERYHYDISKIKPIYATGIPMPKAIDITFTNKTGNKMTKRFWLS